MTFDPSKTAAHLRQVKGAPKDVAERKAKTLSRQRWLTYPGIAIIAGAFVFQAVVVFSNRGIVALIVTFLLCFVAMIFGGYMVWAGGNFTSREAMEGAAKSGSIAWGSLDGVTKMVTSLLPGHKGKD